MDCSPGPKGQYEWEPESGPDAMEARVPKEEFAGAPSTAARETAAATAFKSKASGSNRQSDGPGTLTWDVVEDPRERHP